MTQQEATANGKVNAIGGYQALSEMVGKLDYVRLAMYEYGPIKNSHEAFNLLQEIGAVAVVDCNPTYDAILMSGTSAFDLPGKHMATEAIACRQDIRYGGALARWVYSGAHFAGDLTMNMYNMEHGLSACRVVIM